MSKFNHARLFLTSHGHIKTKAFARDQIGRLNPFARRISEVDNLLCCTDVYERILLQCMSPLVADCVAKVECCRSINFSRKHKREAIADSYNLYRVTKVACEFNVRRWEPSHLYTKTAPVARRIFDHQCKTTFATQSAHRDVLRRRNIRSLWGAKRSRESRRQISRCVKASLMFASLRRRPRPFVGQIVCGAICG